MNRAELAEQWHAILRHTETRQEIFGDLADDLIDRAEGTENDRDRLPHPGFVGRDCPTQGLLFLGLNPANGPYLPGSPEEPHYEHLRSLRDSAPSDRIERFEALMDHDAQWMPHIQLMGIVVQPLLERLNLSFGEIAYLNVLKWRTKRRPRVALLRASLEAHTLSQILTLHPRTIAVLGSGLFNRLSRGRVGEAFGTLIERCVCIPRTNGDNWLSPEGEAGIREAAEHYLAAEVDC